MSYVSYVSCGVLRVRLARTAFCRISEIIYTDFSPEERCRFNVLRVVRYVFAGWIERPKRHSRRCRFFVLQRTRGPRESSTFSTSQNTFPKPPGRFLFRRARLFGLFPPFCRIVPPPVVPPTTFRTTSTANVIRQRSRQRTIFSSRDARVQYEVKGFFPFLKLVLYPANRTRA